jgi:hypothetical protein
MAKREKNLMHDDVKEDNSGENGHKITINRCDGDGWQCGMHWRTVPVDTTMTTTTTTKPALSWLQML